MLLADGASYTLDRLRAREGLPKGKWQVCGLSDDRSPWGTTPELRVAPFPGQKLSPMTTDLGAHCSALIGELGVSASLLGS